MLEFKVGDQAAKLLWNFKQPVVSISNSSYARITSALLIKNFYSFYIRETAELSELKKGFCLHFLNKNHQEKSWEINYQTLFSDKKNLEKFRKIGKDLNLVVYQSTLDLEKAAERFSWRLLVNKTGLKQFLDQKSNFRQLLSQINIPAIPGEIVAVEDLLKWETVKKYARKYNWPLVFQFAQFGSGGIGTFFIKKKADHLLFVKKAKDFIGVKGKGLKVIVSQFIKGSSPSMTGCCTRFGTLCGPLQTQIIDIPQVSHRPPGGVFVGHDWSYCHYSLKYQKQAERIVTKIGKLMYKKGYKGIFSIDFLLDDKKQKLYPVECNPRFTGAFPIFSFLQIKAGEPPFDLFHLLEFLDLDYKIDIKRIQYYYRRPKEGAHLRIRLKAKNPVLVQNQLSAGIYTLDGKKLVFLKPALFPWEIKNDNQFLLVDNLPLKGKVYFPGNRLARIVFKKKILLRPKKLSPWAEKVVTSVYKGWHFKTVRP